MKAVVYLEPYKVTVEEMPAPKIEAPDAYDKLDKRVDGYINVPINPGMAPGGYWRTRMENRRWR